MNRLLKNITLIKLYMCGTVPGLERIRVSVSGGPLPSARLVSSVIHSDRDSDLTSITHMVMQWGQFLDHDLTCKYVYVSKAQ